MQAQLDADASAEEARDASDFSKDEEVAGCRSASRARWRRSATVSFDAAVGDVLRAQRNQIRGWLVNAAQLSVLDVWSNPAAQPGGALYAKFAAAHAAARDKSVRLVFHGTRDENIAKICANGLDPSFRGKNGQALGKGEYFAENVNISIPYCAGGKRMIVSRCSWTKAGRQRQNSIVVVNRTEHQLPMFVISFEMKAGTLGVGADGAPWQASAAASAAARPQPRCRRRRRRRWQCRRACAPCSMFGIAPIGAMPLPVPPPRGRGRHGHPRQGASGAEGRVSPRLCNADGAAQSCRPPFCHPGLCRASAVGYHVRLNCAYEVHDSYGMDVLCVVSSRTLTNRSACYL